jgi:hypothetical protein
MRAFMRMFMDLVGIFNDDQVVPEDGQLPGGKIIIVIVFLPLFPSRCFFWDGV